MPDYAVEALLMAPIIGIIVVTFLDDAVRHGCRHTWSNWLKWCTHLQGEYRYRYCRRCRKYQEKVLE